MHVPNVSSDEIYLRSLYIHPIPLHFCMNSIAVHLRNRCRKPIPIGFTSFDQCVVIFSRTHSRHNYIQLITKTRVGIADF